MTIADDILAALTALDRQATCDELHEKTGRHYNRGSFNTTLYDLVRKKQIRRFLNSEPGGKFIYALPGLKTKPSEPLSGHEIRRRLEVRGAAGPDPDRLRGPGEYMTKDEDSTAAPLTDPPENLDNAVYRSDVADDATAPTLPIIPALDPGIYRIRGTELLLQVKLTGAQMYRLAD